LIVVLKAGAKVVYFHEMAKVYGAFSAKTEEKRGNRCIFLPFHFLVSAFFVYFADEKSKQQTKTYRL